MINYLDIDPAVTVFIDDLYENCTAAKKFGIAAICYNKNDHSEFIREFAAIMETEIL